MTLLVPGQLPLWPDPDLDALDARRALLVDVAELLDDADAEEPALCDDCRAGKCGPPPRLYLVPPPQEGPPDA